MPNFEGIRRDIYSDFELLNPVFLQKIKEHRSETLFWILGCIDGLSFDEMLDFWLISGKAIDYMYNRVITGRVGIG